MVFNQSGNPAEFKNRIFKATGERKAHYAQYDVRKSSILLAETGVRKISYVACRFSSVKIHYSVIRINDVYVFFFNKISYKHSPQANTRHREKVKQNTCSHTTTRT